jgi:hypothetical protein
MTTIEEQIELDQIEDAKTLNYKIDLGSIEIAITLSEN